MKIVVLDGYAANPGDFSWEALKTVGEVTIYDRTRPDEVEERAKDADIILTNKVCLGKKEMYVLPNLKYVGVLATGFNIIDTEEARRRGIIVTNIPAYSTDSVAQMVFAHLLTVTNRVEHYSIANRAGRWTASKDFVYWDTPLTEIAGKTFGIVGLGNIGRKVAEIANAFGLKVIAATSKTQEQLPPYIRKVSREELLRKSDILSLHCPLTADPREMINRESLAMMKPSAILINTGRGPLINEADVAEALQSGRLQAYCTDVLSSEPAAADCPLLQCDNAYITPHVAWATFEARRRLQDIAVAKVQAFANGNPQNVVNK